MENTKSHFNDFKRTLEIFPLNDVNGMVNTIADAYIQDRTVFVIGNGGSASTASHFAADLNKNLIRQGRRPRVLALTDNVEAITAWGNDTDYSLIFMEQLKIFFRSPHVSE